MSNAPPQPLKEYKNLRVLITHQNQAKKLVELFGSSLKEIGACNKKNWLASEMATIYIKDRIVTGWDHRRGDSYTFPWIDYEELVGPFVRMPWEFKSGCEDCGCEEQTIYSADLMTCSNCGQLQDKTQSIETQPSKEDTIMTNVSFETKHFINGSNVEQMSVDQFLTAIQQKKDQIGNLEDIKIESDVLNAQIAAQNKDLALIIGKMEELHGEK